MTTTNKTGLPNTRRTHEWYENQIWMCSRQEFISISFLFLIKLNKSVRKTYVFMRQKNTQKSVRIVADLWDLTCCSSEGNHLPSWRHQNILPRSDKDRTSSLRHHWIDTCNNHVVQTQQPYSWVVYKMTLCAYVRAWVCACVRAWVHACVVLAIMFVFMQ